VSSTNRGNGKRSATDFYPTPPWCVHRLLDRLALPGGRWFEPRAGQGAIISAVNGARTDVTWSSSKLDRTHRSMTHYMLVAMSDMAVEDSSASILAGLPSKPCSQICRQCAHPRAL